MKKCWCGNKDLKEYSEDYYKCEVCHTLICKEDVTEEVYNVHNEENDVYGKNYWEDMMVKLFGVNNLSEVVDAYLRERAAYWFKYLLKYVLPGENVAEIGCGIGAFPFLIKHFGYNQIAFELSPEVCNYARKTLDINIVCGEITNIDRKYKAILAYDLIEHIVNPQSFLSAFTECLENDGIICIQTPCYDENMDYEGMLINNPRFKTHLVNGQHLYLFSKNAIKWLLEKNGFKYINFETPVFGDDYDMFLFASKFPFEINTKEAIDNALSKSKNGRIAKAMVSLLDSKMQLYEKWIASEQDRAARLNVINKIAEERQNIQNEYNLIINEKNKLIENNQNLTNQKDKLIDNNQNLTNEKLQLLERNKTLSREKEKIAENNQVLINEKAQLLEESRVLLQENKTITDRVLIIENSLSWKTTKPLRIISKALKKVVKFILPYSVVIRYKNRKSGR